MSGRRVRRATREAAMRPRTRRGGEGRLRRAQRKAGASGEDVLAGWYCSYAPVVVSEFLDITRFFGHQSRGTSVVTTRAVFPRFAFFSGRCG